MTHTWSLPALSATAGSLDQYIQTVNRIPLLSEEEECDLATRLREKNDLDAARKLVMSHLRVVVSIARGYLGYGLPHADLIQEGSIGLMKAVKRFDPSRGVRLVSFAIHWIKAEIHEYVIRNWRLAKVATTKAQRKLFFNLRSMKGHQSALSRDEITTMADELGVRPEDVTEMEMRLGGRDIPLEGSGNDDDDAFAPIAYLPDPHAEPSEALEQAETAHHHQEGLRQALVQLDARSRDIVQRRWLVEGKSATLHELASEYGVSAERIRQIEASALQKMRGSMTTS